MNKQGIIGISKEEGKRLRGGWVSIMDSILIISSCNKENDIKRKDLKKMYSEAKESIRLIDKYVLK